MNFLWVIPLARFAAVVVARFAAVVAAAAVVVAAAVVAATAVAAVVVAAAAAAVAAAVAVKIETVEQEKRFQKFAFMAVCPFCPAQERCFIFFLVDEGASGHSGRGLASLGQGSLKTDQL